MIGGGKGVVLLTGGLPGGSSLDVYVRIGWCLLFRDHSGTQMLILSLVFVQIDV